MNKNVIENRWDEVKNLIQSRWGKFTNREIESLNGNLDELVTKIQKVYGFARGQAEREYHDFLVSLRPTMQPSVARVAAIPIYQPKRK